MNIVKLSPNWTLQVIKIVLALVTTYSVVAVMDLKIVTMVIIPTFLVLTLFNVMQLRFLHCYKAGIYYSGVLGRQYINADEITDVTFKRHSIITEFKVQLGSGKAHSFYNWQFNEEQMKGILDLYAPNLACRKKESNQRCNA